MKIVRNTHNKARTGSLSRSSNDGHARLIRGTSNGAMRLHGGDTLASNVKLGSVVVQPTVVNVFVTSQASITPSPRPQRPQTAEEWVAQNTEKLQRYAGKWIAVSNRGIVASSSDFDDVFAKAQRKGVPNPLTFKVPIGTTLKIVSAKTR